MFSKLLIDFATNHRYRELVYSGSWIEFIKKNILVLVSYEPLGEKCVALSHPNKRLARMCSEVMILCVCVNNYSHTRGEAETLAVILLWLVYISGLSHYIAIHRSCDHCLLIIMKVFCLRNRNKKQKKNGQRVHRLAILESWCSCQIMESAEPLLICLEE